jgi:hypothetical protein
VTEITASREQDQVDVIVQRIDGSDGIITCMIRTAPFIETRQSHLNAVEFEDYLPKQE